MSEAATPPVPDPRLERAQEWLRATLGHAAWHLTSASSDASFRRYFRVHLAAPDATGRSTLIVMDAPPDKEDCRPFVKVAGLLAAAGVRVPELVAQDLASGYLLLSDLGNTTYLQALQSGADADGLYRGAIDALVAIQKASRPGQLPAYDRALLERELQLFPEWYVGRQLQVALSTAQQQALRACFDAILANNLAQPQVYVHRDYHSRNLMAGTAGAAAMQTPGILDFQDAVYGPITYDLVSLLRDAYIAWPEARVIDWCVRYWEAARRAGLAVNPDFGAFYRDFEWMGAQRQIKVIGIFARLCHRDGKTAYLKDQPLVIEYLRRTCARYGALAPLAGLLEQLAPSGAQTGYTF